MTAPRRRDRPGPTRTAPARVRAIRLLTLALSLVVIAWIVALALQSPGRGPRIAPLDAALTRGDDPTQRGRGLLVRILDKDDPSRVAAELRADAMDPLEAGRYRVQQPRAWYFLDSGETLYLQAESGDIVRPTDDQTPERGVLTGNVQIRLFAPTPGGRRVDPDRDEPIAVLDTPSLSFDSMLGQLGTQDDVAVTSARFDFQGRGFRAFFNQPEQRLNELTVFEGRRLVIRPPAPKPGPPDAPPPTAAPPHDPRTPPEPAVAVARVQPDPPDGTGASDQADPAEPADTPRENRYVVTFHGDVSLVRGALRMDADELRIWARLFGHRLPDGAIAPVLGRSLEGVAAAPSTAVPLPAALAALAVAQPGGDGASPDQTVLTWTGSVTVRPVETTPPELVSDHVFVRASAAGPDSQVRLSDSRSGASATCAQAAYAATSRVARFTGADGVSLDAGEDGTARVDDATVRLDDAAVTIELAGGGSARSGDGERAVRWHRGGVITLSDHGGRQVLRSARFEGAARLSDRAAYIAGEAISADFVRTADGRTTPARMDVAGSVEADDGRAGRLSADSLRVWFDPAQSAADEITPTRVLAQGNIEAAQGASTVRGSRLEADLARTDGDRDVEVVSAVIEGDVRYHSDDGRRAPVRAWADEIRVDAVHQIARLFAHGEAPAWVRSGDMTLNGAQVQLDGENRTALVWGAGSLVRAQAGSDSPLLEARWTTEMTFDDPAGVADARGAVSVRSRTADGTGRDTLAAERLVLRFTPAQPGAPTGGDPLSGVAIVPDAGEPGRALVRAEVWGAAHFEEGGAPATLESRRYDATGRILERLAYVEGTHLIADEAGGRYEVPGPGRLVVADRTAAPERGQDPASSYARGASLFTWEGSMAMERSTGLVSLRDAATLTHIRAGTLEEVRLESDLLEAVLVTEGEAGRLRSARAEGSVYFGAGPRGRPPAREMVADGLEYDAEGGAVRVWAGPGRLVTVLESARATVVRAQRARWDLTADRIVLEGARPVTTPP